MRAAGRAGLVALAVVAGCRSAPSPVPPPSAPRCPFSLAAPITADALGFSVAAASGGLPRDPAELAALVQRHGEGVEPRIGEKDGGRVEPAAVAGASPCALPEERLTLAGPALRYRPVHPTAEERDRVGRRALAASEFPEARAALAAAALLEPELPERAAAVGDGYAAEGRWEEALAVYRDTVTRFPWSFPPRVRLALALRRNEKTTEALRELGRALALRPGARELVAVAARDRLVDLRAPVSPPAERREGADGAVWLVRPTPGAELHGREEARTYARCKETFRRSELLRVLAAGQTGAAWRWSPAEETVCTTLWLAAYVEHRGVGRVEDPALERLWEVAQAGSLDERSIFDVGAFAHPLLPAFLEPAARDRLFAFALEHRVVPREGGLF